MLNRKSKSEPSSHEAKMKSWVQGEMQAEGIVQRIDGQLIARDDSGHTFMVEVTVLDVTGA